MTSKRILIISSEFPPNVGGIGNHSYNLAKALSEQEYAVSVLADIVNVSKSEKEKFANEQSFTITFVARKKVVLLSYVERIIKALQLSAKQDVIICSGKFSLWLSILIRAVYRNKKIVQVVHGSELDIKSRLPRALTRYALTKANTIISVSYYTQKFLSSNLPEGITRVVIHNGINYQEFKSLQQNTLKGEPSLITVGSVTTRKGQENVIRALPEVLKNFPNVHYHIIGKPDLKERLLKVASALKTTEAISFYGAVDRESLLQTLSGATIKLMLSNHTADGDFEGFGIAVLEANAFGIPVIGSKNSGLEDAIVHERTGLLVDPNNAQEIGSAIKIILNNYSFYSFNAKQWAFEHDWKLIVKQYEAALN